MAPSAIKQEDREFVVDWGASMHMISNKDLNSAELETVTTSRSPVAARTMVKCRRMKRPQFQRIGHILDNTSSRIRQQFKRWGNFAMNTDTHMS